MNVLTMEWEPPFLPAVKSPELEGRAKRRLGSVPSYLSYVASSPWVVDATLDSFQPPCFRIAPRFTKLTIFVTSAENACRYCYGGARAQLRLLGRTPAWIDAVENDLRSAELDAREKAVLEFARRLARSTPPPSRAEREGLVALGYGMEETAEIAFLVAVTCLMNRISTFVAVPADLQFEGFPSTWMGMLMRPILRPMLLKRPPNPGPLARNVGPFARVVEGLGSAPCATSLRRSLDDAFAAPGLTRRARALIFAVVARTLGNAQTEDEAKALLEAEGLARAEAETVLTHLASDRLDPVETKLLAWTRDTVRYREPAPMQRSTRALADAIGAGAAVEAVGTAALANSVVRLATLQA